MLSLQVNYPSSNLGISTSVRVKYFILYPHNLTVKWNIEDIFIDVQFILGVKLLKNNEYNV